MSASVKYMAHFTSPGKVALPVMKPLGGKKRKDKRAKLKPLTRHTRNASLCTYGRSFESTPTIPLYLQHFDSALEARF
ncbi:unnamed protein product [Periconia digitata]|uniref:Uncharacterized protein n=1 Tax=Periconia digitata TaxID=1303443 RepID=A0A9W4XYW0_9PLEO|nr:unnamed protein product [Periconia digitata]